MLAPELAAWSTVILTLAPECLPIQLRNPHEGSRIVHVAGSKGKVQPGSVPLPGKREQR